MFSVLYVVSGYVVMCCVQCAVRCVRLRGDVLCAVRCVRLCGDVLCSVCCSLCQAVW